MRLQRNPLMETSKFTNESMVAKKYQAPDKSIAAKVPKINMKVRCLEIAKIKTWMRKPKAAKTNLKNGSWKYFLRTVQWAENHPHAGSLSRNTSSTLRRSWSEPEVTDIWVKTMDLWWIPNNCRILKRELCRTSWLTSVRAKFLARGKTSISGGYTPKNNNGQGFFYVGHIVAITGRLPN